MRAHAALLRLAAREHIEIDQSVGAAFHRIFIQKRLMDFLSLYFSVQSLRQLLNDAH